MIASFLLATGLFSGENFVITRLQDSPRALGQMRRRVNQCASVGEGVTPCSSPYYSRELPSTQEDCVIVAVDCALRKVLDTSMELFRFFHQD